MTDSSNIVRADAAGSSIAKVRAVAEIVERNHVINLQGKRYITVAGATMMATALGYTVREVSVERRCFDDNLSGWEAVCEVIDLETGVAIGRGGGMVADDEPGWSRRPQFARRAMASTRAAGRALRLCLGHLFWAVGTGVQSCTLEEMPQDDKPERRTSKLLPQATVRLRIDSVTACQGKKPYWAVVCTNDQNEELEAICVDSEMSMVLSRVIGKQVDVVLEEKRNGDQLWRQLQNVHLL